MALVRPSVILQQMLAPKDYSEMAVREIKRSFIYIAPSSVVRLPEDQVEEGNILRLCIRLMKPYWDTSDLESCILWDGVMPKWLRNISRNLSNAMRMYNRVHHPFGIGRVVYQWVDFEFDDHVTLRMKLISNTIPAEAPKLATQVRALMGKGAFGDGEIALIRMPSEKSYVEQMEAAKWKKASDSDSDKNVENAGVIEEPQDVIPSSSEEFPKDFAEETDLNSEATVAAMTTESEFNAEVSSELGEAENEDLPEAEEQEDAENDGGGNEEELADEQVQDDTSSSSSELDYSVWGIEYADGTIVEFDTKHIEQ